MRRLPAFSLTAALLCTPALAANETVTDPDAPSLGIHVTFYKYFTTQYQ